MNMDLTPYLPPAWVVWLVGGVCAFSITLTVAFAGYAIWKGRPKTTTPATLEDRLTWFMAAIASSASASGMWKFSGDVLHLDGFFRVLFFAVIEGAIIISALRARRSMRDNYSAGVDGIAVWALTCLTAVLASLDAASFGEVVFRLAVPLVAAWLWERGMRLERRRLRGLSGINWRLTPERLLVRVGLAEATDRTAGEVDAHRRITRVALAAKRLHQLRAAAKPSDRKIRKAATRLERAIDQAVEHTGLAKDQRMQWALLDQVQTLGGADSLADVLDQVSGPWSLLDHPAITGAAKHREATELSDAMREWTDAIKQQRDPETAAAITSMAAWITGKPVGSETLHVTPGVTSPVVTDLVTRRVTDGVTKTARGEVAFAPLERPDVTPLVTPHVTSSVTTNPVTDDVTDPPDPGPEPEADQQSKTEVMRQFWDAERQEGRYPLVSDLAAKAGAHHTLASRKRSEWVTELPWYEQRKANPSKKATAS